MSGVDVAEAINITPQYYYELEKGEKRLNEDLLRKLAEHFNTTTDYLLGRCNNPHPVEDKVDKDETKNPPIFSGDMSNINTQALETIIHRAVKKALDERDEKKKE